ncbi:DUF2059 domain-containing protein [Psychrobacter sanguinis]|uniref:DUF2059 domain-containing protein n=1 Tax=Psychrobacter sanguinis TaxID=861445 RepID=UPI00020C7AD0|nr:DUF2059 domain-containing protein [Psychrobacter sanguinis]EGK11282.1 hypothetical protein HMPREF9373_1809 [Psychrobacter sp. 1501(2011)]MCC3307426.1 DUF2059 domain-containing protein [Psychrobacter sanguinis]MCD9152708.1 DUF2059 domain-containing protein [Psychrobacter sanguinis]MDY3306820.1 DUF2059 domain-containing protein [Psychrobacter sanguinis]UEC24762.1 DUF2059 domain-containing protein [Psychrobacter sanguinis]
MSISHPLLKSAFKPLLTIVAITSISAAWVMPAQAELIISSGAGSNGSAIATTTAAQNSISTQNSTTQNGTTQNGIVVNQQIPTDASVLKLMQVMHVDEQIDAIINGQQAVSDILEEQGNKSRVNEAKLNKRQRELAKNMQSVLAQYTKILAGGVQGTANKEELTQAYLAAAKAHYNQQEVNALIGFYDTQIGQSILEKNPKVTSEFLKASLPDEAEMKQTTEQLEGLMPQIKQLIKGVF